MEETWVAPKTYKEMYEQMAQRLQDKNSECKFVAADDCIYITYPDGRTIDLVIRP